MRSSLRKQSKDFFQAVTIFLTTLEEVNHNSKDINGEELAGTGMGEEEEDGKGDGNVGDDRENMYVKHLVDNGCGDEEDVNDGKDIDGSENGSEDEDGNSGKDIRGVVSGDKEEDGENEDINEGRNGSRSAKKAGMKRKVTQDDEPATATRAKRTKLDISSRGHQAATKSTRKAVSKGKYSKK